MGAGKSSVGRALAARRGAVFIDLDQRVEAIFG
ncbi:shikimate kinase, partial [Pseudenhygromyxa sp. WMMC2535]|nr:shikimate kinase [Pseudenhygromyxa sp. WMMC2535]